MLGLMFSRAPKAHGFRRVSAPTSGLWPHFCGYNHQPGELKPFAKPQALSLYEGQVLGHINMDMAVLLISAHINAVVLKWAQVPRCL